MRAAVYLNRTGTGGTSPHMMAVAQGLSRHGISVSYFNDRPDDGVDFAVVWGWRKGARLRAAGFAKPILVAERAYLPDRFEWTSLGWDGLNGRARWPEAQDGGERFWRHWGDRACEWERFDGYHLVIGQVLGDTALTMVNFQEWVEETIDALDKMGVDVRFRPHPEAVRRGQQFRVPDYMVIGGTLSEALSEATCVVTWNSNTGVDAVLAGVPAVAFDEGAMAWPVTSHNLSEPLATPDRTEWFRDMAWRQWTMADISSGFAWSVVREAM